MLSSETAWQAAAFTGANLFANACAVVTTALLTRNLSTAEFGSYSFAISFLFFVALFFEFGIFAPAARLAAVVETRGSREVVGAALLAYVPVGLAYSATVFALSFWVDKWFHVEAGHALRVTAFVAIAYPFIFVLQQLAQGVSRLHIGSIGIALVQAVLLALLALRLEVGGGLNTSVALVLRGIAVLAAGLVSAVWLRPAFRACRRWVDALVQQAREWGFQLYVGRVLSIGTYNMDVLMIGIWTNSRSVGFYALAGSLAAASGLPVTGMAGALFARLTRERTIARRWLLIATGVGLACALSAWLLADVVIRVFFSGRYLPAATLVLPLALAQFVRGITGIFNTFLSAHRRGRDLRNAGLVLTLSNLAFNFALIPPYGARGAAWASLGALVANLVAHAVFYRRSFAL